MITEFILGKKVHEFADYLDTIVAKDKIQLVKDGLGRLMSVCYFTGLVCGIVIGLAIMWSIT